PKARSPRSASSSGKVAAMLPPPIGVISRKTTITDGSTTSTVQATYARYLPMTIAQRAIGRVNRYVIVRSSTSSEPSAVPYHVPTTDKSTLRYISQMMWPDIQCTIHFKHHSRRPDIHVTQ